MRVQINEVPAGGLPPEISAELRWLTVSYDETVPVSECRSEIYGYRSDVTGYVLKVRHVIVALTEARRDATAGFFKHFPHPYLWVSADICELIPN